MAVKKINRSGKKINLKTPRVKQPRMSRAVIKSIDDKHYGPEPIDISKKGLGDALNWYNYMYEQEETRDWMFEYMKRNEYSKADIAAVKKLAKYKITKTSCSIARIIMNGNKLEDQVVERLHASIDAYITEGRSVVEEKAPEEGVKVEKAGPNIQERIQLKIKALITECEEAVDKDDNLNIYQWLQGKEVSVQAANAIRDYYSNWVSDFQYEDEFETRAEKKKRLERLAYWEGFVADCDRYCGNKKATKIRKPREKKVKSAVDQVSKLKYQKEFPSLKIVSVNPAEMVGASQVWVYNTKYRKLTRFDAMGPAGIQVKGAGLIGFDPEKSTTKRLRKPEDTIKQLLSAGKVALRTIMSDIKAIDSQANGRINNDTIILRVIK